LPWQPWDWDQLWVSEDVGEETRKWGRKENLVQLDVALLVRLVKKEVFHWSQ
jgi:hypothetical protein